MTDFSQRTALIVDDEPIVREILHGMFKALGFRDVAVCSDGFESIDRMQEAKFDLAVIDIRLGTEDGLDIARALRRLDGREGTRILVVTASRDYGAVIAAKRAGADDILLKPFTRDVLRERLEKLFAGRR